jgi:hypothetical protein
MLGLGYLMQAICGQPQQIFNGVIAWIDGLDCEPASPPSLNITVGAGSIYEMEQIDSTSYGVLGVDTGQVLKQGLLTAPVTETITPPATSGYSQYYIVQAIYNDVDGGPTVLPYYNAANPTIPLGGPGNSGQQQYTIRQGVCVVSLKAGVAAPTGSQAIPAADAGYTPLWSILVSNGQTQITSVNINPISDAPFISPKLTQVPPAIQAQKDNYANDTGPSANVMQVTLPSFTNVVAGLTLRINKKAPSNTATPTLSINGGAPVTIAWADGNALAAGDWPAGAIGQITFNGTYWELYSIAGPSIFARVAPGSTPVVTDASLLHYGVDTGTANAAACASVTPSVSTAVSVGMAFEVQKTSAANTGSMTLSITTAGGTTVAPLYWADGNSLQAGDWPASAVALCMFDGTYYRILSIAKRPIAFSEGAYVHYGVASGANTLTLTSAPVFTSMADGIFLEMTPTQVNTGPVTLAANGLNPAAVQNLSGSNLASGQLQPSQPVLLMALGGVWKLFAGGGGGAGGGTIKGLQVIVSSGTYTPTSGATQALVFCTGGGGAGGSSSHPGGGGGGAGATAIALVNLSGISNVACTVGAGGAAVFGVNTTGGTGGASSFGSYAAGNGGYGGHLTFGGLGGSPTLGAMQIPGGDGGIGVNTGYFGPGGGGASFWGGGGRAGLGLTEPFGYPGRAYGSGGGGADGFSGGVWAGNGMSGVILVVEF